MVCSVDDGEIEENETLMVRTLEILWHCNDRGNEAEQLGLQSCAAEGITSIDWSAHDSRLVTTGGDKCIRIWRLNDGPLSQWVADGTKDMSACVTHICCMKCSWMPMTARWSPHGKLVVSAHCDGKICLWWPERQASGALVFDDNGDEVWKDFRHLSGHVNDVYDVSFSPDSRYVISGGGDGCVLVHDLEGSTMPVVQLSDCHSKFCRGVSWDPWNRYLMTFGGGPSLQCFTHVPKRVTESSVRRMSVAGQRRCHGDYVGDTCGLFFRRMGWSPDGVLLAVPFGKAAHISQLRRQSLDSLSDSQVENDMVHCINIYSRNSIEKVAARLTIKGKSEVRGVSWAPCFLEPEQSEKSLHNAFFPLAKKETRKTDQKTEGDGRWGPKAYAMALAAWTPDAVIVYTTSSSVRHSDFTDLHMRSITDLAWSPTASYLLTASLDGYVSVIAFHGTLSRTHRLPLFVDSPTIQSMCDIFVSMKSVGVEVESSYYSKLAPSSESSSATVVKKKKKIERKEPTEIDAEQLNALMA